MFGYLNHSNPNLTNASIWISVFIFNVNVKWMYPYSIFNFFLYAVLYSYLRNCELSDTTCIRVEQSTIKSSKTYFDD
jgi:hypothetical protein